MGNDTDFNFSDKQMYSGVLSETQGHGDALVPILCWQWCGC